MADVKQPWAGPAFKLLTTTNSVKTLQLPQPSPSLCMFVVISFLVLYPLRSHILAKNNPTCNPAKGSQHVLYSRLTDSGRATMPTGKHGTAKAYGRLLGLTHLTIILLLAGDVETNPGPVQQPYLASQLATTRQLPVAGPLPLLPPAPAASPAGGRLQRRAEQPDAFCIATPPGMSPPTSAAISHWSPPAPAASLRGGHLQRKAQQPDALSTMTLPGNTRKLNRVTTNIVSTSSSRH